MQPRAHQESDRPMNLTAAKTSWRGPGSMLLTAILITQVSLVAGPAAADEVDETIQEVDELIRQCQDAEGNPDIFEVKDVATGQNYEVVVMQGVTSGDVRSAWNAQIPRTYEGANSELTSGGIVTRKAFQGMITGDCGYYIGTPSGSTFAVKISFMGQDITVENSEGSTIGITVSVKLGLKFRVKPTGLEAFDVEAEATSSYTYENSYTVTTHGYLKVFEQGGYDNLLPPGCEPCCNSQQNTGEPICPADD